MPNTGSRQQSTFTVIVPPKVHRKSAAAAAIVTCAAALTALFGAIAGYAHWYETAVIVLMVAATVTVGIRTTINAHVLERIRQDGYDDGYEGGYEDGLHAKQAQVIRIDSRSAAVALAHRGAPQKLC